MAERLQRTKISGARSSMCLVVQVGMSNAVSSVTGVQRCGVGVAACVQ